MYKNIPGLLLIALVVVLLCSCGARNQALQPLAPVSTVTDPVEQDPIEEEKIETQEQAKEIPTSGTIEERLNATHEDSLLDTLVDVVKELAARVADLEAPAELQTSTPTLLCRQLSRTAVNSVIVRCAQDEQLTQCTTTSYPDGQVTCFPSRNQSNLQGASCAARCGGGKTWAVSAICCKFSS